LNESARTHNAARLDWLLNHWQKLAELRRRQDNRQPDHTAYARKALEEEVTRVAGAASGGRNNILNEAAFSLGTLIGAGLLKREEVEENLTAAGNTCGLGEAEIKSTIRSGIEAGLKCPRKVPESAKPYSRPNDQPVAPGQPDQPAAAAAKTAEPPDQGISCADLMTLDLPEPKYVVAGLLPEGLIILAARPKIGKSWMALQMALGIAQGAVILGSLGTIQGDVLYLALEDTRRRLKKRVTKLLASTKWLAPPALQFRTASLRANQGGLNHIANWIASNPNARLVIVDTLAKFRSPSKGKGDSYTEDYEAISGLKAIADQYGVTILVIHHSRKADAESPFDQVSGTLGLTGAADATFVIHRSHDSADAQLFVTGRDVEEETLTIRWDQAAALWTLGNRETGIKRPVVEPKKQVNEKTLAWLKEKLSNGARRVHELRTLAETDGISSKTLYAAKTEMEVEEFDQGGKKFWRDPNAEPTQIPL
jgi:hypothetical protein